MVLIFKQLSENVMTPFKACKQLLVAEDSPDDHPDIRWLLNDLSIYDLYYDIHLSLKLNFSPCEIDL